MRITIKSAIVIVASCSLVTACGGTEGTYGQSSLAGKGGKGGGGSSCPEGTVSGKKGACFSQPSQCSDGLDNDGNGVADCDDSACSGASECQAPLTSNPSCITEWNPEGHVIDTCTFNRVSQDLCYDGVDNDGDGNTDYWDDDCTFENFDYDFFPTCISDYDTPPTSCN